MHLRDVAIPVLFSMLLRGTEPPSRADQAFLSLLEAPVCCIQVPNRIALQEAPDERASLETLVRYWRFHQSELESPSPSVSQRLLEVCEQNPPQLIGLLELLPKTLEAHLRIEHAWRFMPENDDAERDWKSCVKDWLMCNTEFFRDELVQQARSAGLDEEGSINYQGWMALNALAQRDWPMAKNLVTDMERAPEPVRATLALSLHYSHEMEIGSSQAEGLRNKLRKIAEDIKACGWARNESIRVLLDKPWDGREAWYLGLFKDASLLHLTFGDETYNPLASPIQNDPDRWAPVLTRMLKGQGVVARDFAVEEILNIPLDKIQAGSLELLLPWLEDPQWSGCGLRNRYLMYLQQFELPEAIPGMVSILATSSNDREVSLSAAFLARNPAPSAIPFLRTALERPLEEPTQELGRHALLAALFRCGGLTEEESMNAIQAFAQWKVQNGPNIRQAIQNNAFPTAASIGRHLSMEVDVQRQLVVPILKRARSLETSNPSLANALRKEIWTWSVPEADQELIRRLATSDPLLSDLQAAANRRESLVSNQSEGLAKFSRGTGWRAGMASVLLKDTDRTNTLLAKSDNETRVAILATARMLHFPLDFGRVALLSLEGRGLAAAADRYLKAFAFH